MFSKYCHIFKILKKNVIFKLSYKNMTIFANCHIFLKIVIFPKYDKKKTNAPPQKKYLVKKVLGTAQASFKKFCTSDILINFVKILCMKWF